MYNIHIYLINIHTYLIKNKICEDIFEVNTFYQTFVTINVLFFGNNQILLLLYKNMNYFYYT